MRFGKTIVDIGTQCMKRNAAFTVPFGTRDFRTVQTAGAHNLDALGTQAHGVLHRALHRTAEHDALFDLLRDAVGNKLGIEFRTAHFFNRNVRGNTNHLLDIGLELFDISTLLADYDTGTSRVNRNASIVGGTLNDNARDARRLQLFHQEGANLQIFTQRAREVTTNRVPTRRPIARHGKAEAGRINFLTHGSPLLVADGHIDVRRLLTDTLTAALGAGTEAAQRRSLFHVNLCDAKFIDIGTVIVLGIGDSAFKCLQNNTGRTATRELQNVKGLVHGLTANQVGNQATLLSRQAHTANDCSSFHLITP